LTSDDNSKDVSPLAQTVDATAAKDPLVGTTLGHYRIVGRLGQGGMGVVYRAEDEKLRRAVALKVLPDTSGNEERRQRFLREARSAAAITHPNVAVVYQVDEADGRIYIAMELVEGENLRQRLERGRLDLATAKDLAGQIARGLAAAHEKGIVHRDLKPENVMITPAGQVKLLDFGLAKVGVAPASGKTAAAMAKTETVVTSDEGRIMGTPEYMSPEQALGEPLDVRSDVFSLGIVLYEMFSGSRPFAGTTTGAVLVAIARDVAPPLREKAPDVDEAMAAVVMKCLEKAPGERFAGAGEVVGALVGVSVLATKVPPAGARTGEAPGPIRRSRTAGYAAVGLGLAAMASFGAWRLAPRTTAPASAPVASASAAPSASANPMDGMSRSSNPEAQRSFQEAMRSFHDGTGQTIPLMQAAVKADPTFASAYLRLWWMTNFAVTVWRGGDRSEHVDEYHRRVLALQSVLSPREREFLDATEDPDGRRANEKLDAYLARYPDDELAWVARLDGGLATAQRAAAAQPTLVPVLAAEAEGLLEDWRDDEASAVIARCLALSPRASDCLSQRAQQLDTRGDCGAAEADVRRWLVVQPDSRTARPQLAGLLAAQGAPVDAIREALAADTSTWFRAGEIGEALIPMFEGDFAEVERIAKDALARVPSTGTDYEHFRPTETLVHAYVEAGDAGRAAGVATDYLARRAAWKEGYEAQRGSMSVVAARGGRLDRAEASRRMDAAFLAFVEPDAGAMDLAGAWDGFYAEQAESPAEARAAIAKLDALGCGLPRGGMSAAGRVLFLTGRGTDARPRLERAVGACSSVLLFPRNWVHNHLYLGELDEQSGDKPSACAHYAKVLERWGRAKPRSVTADEARAHATKLGCAL
jgi:serine/threonine protein kinase